MTTATVQIAQHLNILESAIKEVQEWANVLFVKFVSGRPRFVSKKVMKKVMQGTEKQIKWAEAIVKDCKFWLNREIKKGMLSQKQVEAIELALQNSDAKFWIEKVSRSGGYTGSKLVWRLTETIKGYHKLPQTAKAANRDLLFGPF